MPNLEVLAVPLLTALLATGPAAPPDTVLEDLLAEASERNPDIQAAASAAAAARQRPPQAHALPDPRLGLVFTNEGWSPSLGSMPDTSLGLIVAQDLPFPGKRRLRGRLAELEAVEFEQRLERTRLSVMAAVRRAYYDLLAARALRQITTEQAEPLPAGRPGEDLVGGPNASTSAGPDVGSVLAGTYLERRVVMTARSAGLTLVLIAVGGLLGPVARTDGLAGEQPASKKDAEMGVPATVDEHLARATTYQEKAAAYRQEAAFHRKMLADYDRRYGDPVRKSKRGSELPWIAKMRKHCDGYIKDAERLAADADRFAEFHRMRAEEMRGK
jgi:outer membrane protein TolC